MILLYLREQRCTFSEENDSQYKIKEETKMQKKAWINISKDTKSALAEIAEEQETDVNSLVEELLQSFVEGYDGEDLLSEEEDETTDEEPEDDE